MHGLRFVQNYEGKRVEREFGAKQFWIEDETGETDDAIEETNINLNLEMESGAWQIVNPQLPKSRRVACVLLASAISFKARLGIRFYF